MVHYIGQAIEKALI